MNLPNSLTVVRIFLVPLLVVVLLTNFEGWPVLGVGPEWLGAAIFGIASLTDWLDGYLARRRKQVTDFGQWMDPLADKFLVTAALFALVSMRMVPAWMAAIIIGREFLVTVLRSIAYARGQSLPAAPLGKIKLVSQVVAILALMLSHGPVPELLRLGQVALWVATLAALVSAVDYYRRFNTAASAKTPPVATPPAAQERQRDRASA